MAAISYKTFWNAFSWMKMYEFCLKFDISLFLSFNIPTLVQIMTWHQPGNKPLSEPMIVSLLMHICITRPQWINWYPLMISYFTYVSCCNNSWGKCDKIQHGSYFIILKILLTSPHQLLSTTELVEWMGLTRVTLNQFALSSSGHLGNYIT